MSGSTPGEKPGTKILDYIGLGLLLAPPAVVVDLFLKDGSLGGTRLFVATISCWLLGAFVVLASHHWQSWMSADGRIFPFLVAAENKFLVKGLIVATSMGLTLALSSFLAPPANVNHGASTAEDIAKSTAPTRDDLDAAKKSNLTNELADAIKDRDSSIAEKELYEKKLRTTTEALERASKTISELLAAGRTSQEPAQPARTVLAVGPEYFIDLAKRKYGDSKEDVVKPYIGQWMKITALFNEIESRSPTNILNIFATLKGNEFDLELLSMKFNRSYENKIILLKHGDEFTATCKIDSQSGLLTFNLSECEL